MRSLLITFFVTLNTCMFSLVLQDHFSALHRFFIDLHLQSSSSVHSLFGYWLFVIKSCLPGSFTLSFATLKRFYPRRFLIPKQILPSTLLFQSSWQCYTWVIILHCTRYFGCDYLSSAGWYHFVSIFSTISLPWSSLCCPPWRYLPLYTCSQGQTRHAFSPLFVAGPASFGRGRDISKWWDCLMKNFDPLNACEGRGIL